MTHFLHKALAPHHWTGALSALTVCFGIGQTAGPLLVGAISDVKGGIPAGLAVSAAILLMATLAALFQCETNYQERRTNPP